MAGKEINMKVSSSLKLRSGLTGNYLAICHYSYNLPLYLMVVIYLTLIFRQYEKY